MNLSLMDWTIVTVVICACIAMAIYTRRYSRGVADFLSGNRCAGRYLLCIASGMAMGGAEGIVLQMQLFYNAGLANSWWQYLINPLTMILVISGWIVYRFRETRALTMAQFFEIRYSRKFRVFTGIIAFVAGIINYGVLPAIGTSFFMYYCNLPQHIGIFSTFHVILFSLLAISLYSTLSGGQVAVIATDFLQGMFTNFVFFAIFVLVLKKFGVGGILDGLEYAPPGKSMLNPLDIQGNNGFNLWYFLIITIITLYSYRVWQGQQGYNCAAKTPHEAKMAGILGTFRWIAFLGAITFIPLCAYTIMHHPEYADKAALVQPLLDNISNPEIRNQMITPIVMTTFLPSGLIGCFAAAMFAAFIASHNTQLHSWGSILIQDVILPLRKKTTPLSPKIHVLLLKFSIALVAIIAFTFSCLFKQTQHFQLYAMVSGSVFVGGAGVAIIGGLYWKRGTTTAAWGSMIAGATLSIAVILIEQYWTYYKSTSFPIDYKWCAAIVIACCITIYGVISLLSHKEFNIEKMLHRGKYNIGEDHENKNVETTKVHFLLRVFGVTKEFSRFDKALCWYLIIKMLFFVVYVLVITSVYLIFGFSDRVWKYVHAFSLWTFIPLFIPTAIWLTIGGFRDLIRFFKELNKIRQNDLDDGTVVSGHNLADEL